MGWEERSKDRENLTIRPVVLEVEVSTQSGCQTQLALRRLMVYNGCEFVFIPVLKKAGVDADLLLTCWNHWRHDQDFAVADSGRNGNRVH